MKGHSRSSEQRRATRAAQRHVADRRASSKTSPPGGAGRELHAQQVRLPPGPEARELPPPGPAGPGVCDSPLLLCARDAARLGAFCHCSTRSPTLKCAFSRWDRSRLMRTKHVGVEQDAACSSAFGHVFHSTSRPAPPALAAPLSLATCSRISCLVEF